MSLYTIQQATLTGIGDAIRAKGGTSESIPVTGLADAITNLPSGGGGDLEIPTDITCAETRYLFGGDRLTWMLDLVPPGEKIYFHTGNNTEGLVAGCGKNDLSRFKVWTSYLAGPLGDGAQITALPEIRFTHVNSNNGYHYFKNMRFLKSIPNDFFYRCNPNTGEMTTNMGFVFPSYVGLQYCFMDCRSLRALPELPKTFEGEYGSFYYAYEQTFSGCVSLDKIEGLTVAVGTIYENQFINSFTNCNRISEMTFATDNGTPYKVSWSNQTIDLSSVGFGFRSSDCNEYNGLSKDDERIQTAGGWVNENIHIERPDDWWASESTYGRYNHDSAVRTINSLPDCSGGSNNIVKFRRDSGTATGPNANNSCGALTDAEIAVATSKGWTITFYG